MVVVVAAKNHKVMLMVISRTRRTIKQQHLMEMAAKAVAIADVIDVEVVAVIVEVIAVAIVEVIVEVIAGAIVVTAEIVTAVGQNVMMFVSRLRTLHALCALRISKMN
jgi:hypothetical protein